MQALRRTKKPYRPGVDPVPEQVRRELSLPEIPKPRRSPNSSVQAVKPPAGARILFADADQRAAEIEYAFQLMRARGDLTVLRSDIVIPATSMDRNFSQGEFEAISWFAKFHAAMTGGCLRFLDGGAPATAHLAHLSDGERSFLRYVSTNSGARNEYGYVAERLPESFAAILDWVSALKYPQFFHDLDEKMPTKVEVAKSMFSASDEKYLRGGIDGFFKAVCQLLAHLRIEWQMLDERRKAVQERHSSHRPSPGP